MTTGFVKDAGTGMMEQGLVGPDIAVICVLMGFTGALGCWTQKDRSENRIEKNRRSNF